MSIEASRLNLVCVDSSDFSYNGFIWYVNNFHREDDTVGLVHVHEIPSVPTVGVLAGAMMNNALTEQLKLEMNKSLEAAKSTSCLLFCF